MKKKANFLATTPFKKMLIIQVYSNKISYREASILILIFEGVNIALMDSKEIKTKLGITKKYLQVLLRILIQRNWIIKENSIYKISNETKKLYNTYIHNCHMKLLN